MLDTSDLLFTKGKFMKVHMMGKELTLEFLSQNAKDSAVLCSKDSGSIVSIPLPEEISSQRIIGKPICIGCQDCLYVFQYITTKHKYLRFFTFDIDSRCVQVFDDTQNYFHRDFTVKNPLECHISPDRETVLLRLPQNLMTCRKWAKLLMVDSVENKFEHLNSTTLFKGTKASPLRDRKFQAFAFYPDSPNTILTVLVDEFCSKCKFAVCDLSKGSRIIIQKVHRLGSRSVTIKSDTSDSDSETDENETYFTLHQISMSFCKSGEFVSLCCVTIDNREVYNLKVYLYDPKTLVNVTSKTFSLCTSLDPTVHLICIYSVCDSEIQMWERQNGGDIISKRFSWNLPKSICLKSLCRARILSICHTNNLQKLVLPKALINYLNFVSLD